MTYHGYLAPLHRDAVVAMAAANDPCVPAYALTASQLELRDLCKAINHSERGAFNHWPYMWRLYK